MRGRAPLLLGLTGGFGSGKSTVAELFAKRGAAVIDADKLAHEVYRKGSRLSRKIRALLPELKGNLSRSRIAEIIFRRPEKRKRLESLVHPYVFERVKEEIGRAKANVVVLEVPLLFESGFDRLCDRTLAVTAGKGQILARLRARGFSSAEIRRREKAQLSLREKVKRADDVIDNSKNLEETGKQVERIWNRLNHPI